MTRRLLAVLAALLLAGSLAGCSDNAVGSSGGDQGYVAGKADVAAACAELKKLGVPAPDL